MPFVRFSGYSAPPPRMPSLPRLQALISNGTSLNSRLILGSEVHPQTPSSADTHPSTWRLHVPSRSSHGHRPPLPGEARPKGQSRGAQIRGGWCGAGRPPCHEKPPPRATFTETPTLLTQAQRKVRPPPKLSGWLPIGGPPQRVPESWHVWTTPPKGSP